MVKGQRKVIRLLKEQISNVSARPPGEGSAPGDSGDPACLLVMGASGPGGLAEGGVKSRQDASPAPPPLLWELGPWARPARLLAVCEAEPVPVPALGCRSELSLCPAAFPHPELGMMVGGEWLEAQAPGYAFSPLYTRG